jgi:hypothetical protein
MEPNTTDVPSPFRLPAHVPKETGTIAIMAIATITKETGIDLKKNL